MEKYANKMLATPALGQREPARETTASKLRIACKDGYTQPETTSALMLSAYIGLFTPSLIFCSVTTSGKSSEVFVADDQTEKCCSRRLPAPPPKAAT